MTTNVTPPICHIIEPHELRVGDHIYRRLIGIKALFGYHHAIVTETRNNVIKVIEMTSIHGIQINTLTKFLQGYKCRKVYYNTRKFDQTLHASGTCHIEQSSSIKDIKQRIKQATFIINSVNVFSKKSKKNQMNNQHDEKKANPKIYALLGANCEEFAIWIKTGLYKGVEMSQLKGAERKLSCIVGQPGEQAAVSTFSTAMTYMNPKTTLSTSSETLGTAVKSAAITEEVLKYSISNVSAGIGIAVAIEAVISGVRIYKCKTDYKYTKCDLWRDLGRSWIVTGIVTAVGIALLPIGWWAIIPTVFLGLLLNWIFHRFNIFDKKSHKEKVYKEYKLKKNSSVRQLKLVRRKIRKQIKSEKLHPDNWPVDLKEEDRPKRLEKFLWLMGIIELLTADITRGYIFFEKCQNKKNKTQSKLRKQIEYNYIWLE